MKPFFLLGLLLAALPAFAEPPRTPPGAPTSLTAGTPEAEPDPVAEEQAAGKPSPGVPQGALEVTATGTLEWLRQDNMYVARQNAVARHNDTTLKGDVLVAHYVSAPGKTPQGQSGEAISSTAPARPAGGDKGGGGSTQITLVTADGKLVELISPSAVVYGQHGVYDLNRHIAVLLGDNLKLVTTDEVVTARDSMEYFEDLDTGVARGDAVMIRGEDKLTADTIAAKFIHSNDDDNDDHTKPGSQPDDQDKNGGKQSSRSLERLDARGHVVLVTPTDYVTGNEAVYNPITDQTTVIGNVHVTRDQNQLDGARAEVDMGTGISRVYAAPNARVKGLFVPKKKDDNSTGDGQATAEAQP